MRTYEYIVNGKDATITVTSSRTVAVVTKNRVFVGPISFFYDCFPKYITAPNSLTMFIATTEAMFKRKKVSSTLITTSTFVSVYLYNQITKALCIAFNGLVSFALIGLVIFGMIFRITFIGMFPLVLPFTFLTPRTEAVLVSTGRFGSKVDGKLRQLAF